MADEGSVFFELRLGVPPSRGQTVDKTRRGGRLRQPLENYPCTCGQCGQTEKPKKSCPRGNVIYKRLQRERVRLSG
jgi:hypothetical protein